ncbi:MAG: NAD-dependent deacylase [Gammaproteobacteria bacterium]|nr:MAG: NAD-dependent deacylase [Gammaproteobacteria bacterium]
MKDEIALLAEALRKSNHTVVLTGAGVSAESGVPTFRDTQTGLWANYRPEDLATPEAFARDPKMVWQWYAWRRQLLATVQPNPGHIALAQLQDIIPEFTLITQNVDGLHQQAGSRDVVELHGNINRTVCSDKSCSGQPEPGDKREPPWCGICATLMRPDVVWFGEAMPELAMRIALAALANCDLFIAIGTSAVVYPAAGMAQQAAAKGAIVAEINLQATSLTSAAEIAIGGPSGKVLPALITFLAS